MHLSVLARMTVVRCHGVFNSHAPCRLSRADPGQAMQVGGGHQQDALEVRQEGAPHRVETVAVQMLFSYQWRRRQHAPLIARALTRLLGV